MSRLPVFDVTCMLCGRQAGHVVGGRYIATRGVEPPVVRADGLHCAVCHGRMYLDQDPLVDARQLLARAA